MLITARLLDKALKGDLYAMGMVRDQIGEQITQKQELSGSGIQINFNRDYE